MQRETQVLIEYAVADGQPLVTTVVNGVPYIVPGVVSAETQLQLNVDGNEVESEPLSQMICHADGKLYVYYADVNQLQSNDASLIFMELAGVSNGTLKADYLASR